MAVKSLRQFFEKEPQIREENEFAVIEKNFRKDWGME